jgi:hypothetical protein
VRGALSNERPYRVRIVTVVLLHCMSPLLAHKAAARCCPHSRKVLEGKRTKAPAGELAEVNWAVGIN